jgi:uncharacterized membrane protein YjgN (DUF898 family)
MYKLIPILGLSMVIFAIINGILTVVVRSILKELGYEINNRFIASFSDFRKLKNCFEKKASVKIIYYIYLSTSLLLLLIIVAIIVNIIIIANTPNSP